jgi:thioredoxin-dependent peroxiredoxin
MVAAASAGAWAQQPAAATPPKPGSAAFAPDTGVMAPDFTLTGITQAGIMSDKIKLSNYRGQTVVLAFFPKARTRG